MKPLFGAALIGLGVIMGATGCSQLSSRLQAETAPASQDNVVHWRGVLVSGFEVSAFTPCGSQQDYWLYVPHETATTTAMAKRFDDIRLQQKQPYPALYVEFTGVNEGKAEDGFPADYDAVLRLEQLKTYSETIPAACQVSQ
ncbi:hypothetical protein NFHSH190041_29800 [Shewanella sp. NFH-SH190041]|uniref:hypothetical protein n=1 Tax=Shewanella sp. NFH-SH190041 TaxID=2950245 RepID=UPI0021C4935D|nr:hypothetical protein [Shewanella sp. NFH-SH190041]BDM65528.1 hypothetical protein NFHSH190041_29800 [Shewanella sp. NFH-SH190041]